ncbi:MAG: helix-turn-helix transcriptional regulator [Candidatus Onthovivens sp.]|nr:helix-turn-helix transcriptional regulator [Candidatus Onthovivens sp.]
MTIGEKVKKARLKMVKTQAEMAQDLGCTIATICHIEKGNNKPRINFIKKFYEVYNINLNK